MITPKQRDEFMSSQTGKDIKVILQRMVNSDAYTTVASYSTNSLLYPDNLIPFVDKHLNYLMAHPKLEAAKYVANIKLMSRVR